MPGLDALDLGLLAAMAIAVALLVLAERAGSQKGKWIWKPAASALFLLLAWPVEEWWIFAALVLSFLGDLCLIPKDARIFRAGILLFLLAHVAFAGAFLARGVGVDLAAVALVPLAIAALLVGRWILPKVPKPLLGAVVAYIVVITAMVALAVGTHDPALAIAALAFWTNDILVARDRFVTPTWRNRLWGLPLYYGAMAIFALLASGAV